MQIPKSADDRNKPPMGARLRSVPGALGIRLDEEPKYLTIYEDESFEVREYPPLVTANLKLDLSLDEFRSAAFTRLAAYIFGNEIEMMVPVFIQRDPSGWEMSFILPERFGFMTAPQPNDQDIEIRAIPGRRVASCRYSGSNTKDRMTYAIFRLQTCLRKHPRFVANSNVWWAQYDPPYTVPFMKRNEVHVEVIEIWPH